MIRVATAAAAAAIGLAALASADDRGRQDLPDGVTPELIDEGRGLFAGAGMCFNCHGRGGTGVPGVGGDLTDDRWVATDGSFPDLVRVITSGVTAERSESGVPMPPRGGSGLTDQQLRAAAAFVWSLRLSGP